MTRTAKLLLGPILLFQVVFFIFISLHRFIDGDEGFYLLASRLVLMHKTPYVDFFYTQAPLLPYVYALWMKCTAVSWTSARVLSALLTALLGSLLYEHVCRETRNCLAGVIAVMLFASSTLVFAFYPTAKTFSLAGLFLFVTYRIIGRPSKTSPGWLIGVSGLIFGLSVDTRSYLILLGPLFVWWICRNSDKEARRTSILWFLGGCTIAVLPCIYLFVSAPGAFLFDNLGTHAIRTNAGLIGKWGEKLAAILVLFLGYKEGSNAIQDSILFLISVAFISLVNRRRYPPRLALQIAVVLGIISLLPTPSIPQYFSLCIPFLLVSAVCTVSDLIATLDSRRGTLVAIATCVAVVGIYLAASANDFRHYLITSEGVPGVKPGHGGDWRLQRVLDVSQAIDQIAIPGESVASFWPGYLLQTKVDPFPGFENDFGLFVSVKVTAQQRSRYHILSPAEIVSSFAAHNPRIVVLGNENYYTEQVMGNTARSSLRANGYTLIRSIDGASIYVYRSDP